MTCWEVAYHTYRAHLETLALMLPPFRVADSASQISAQVASQLQAAVAAIDVFAQCYRLPAWHDTMTKVRQQVPARAALVDVWWQSAQQDLAPCVLSPRWRQWMDEGPLSMIYGDYISVAYALPPTESQDTNSLGSSARHL